MPNLTGSAGATRYYSYSETDRSDRVTGVYSGATTGLNKNHEDGGADNFTCSLAFNASYSNSASCCVRSEKPFILFVYHFGICSFVVTVFFGIESLPNKRY